jgi:paraquat-inducible protein B
MTEEQQSGDNLSEEFRNLGHNLMNAMRAAWDNPERKKLQQEIEAGLDEFTSTVKEEADHFSQSPTGQRIKSDIGDLQERVRSGDVETKIRDDLLAVLRSVNTELEKASANLKTEEAEEAEEMVEPPSTED